jgi:Holliday junction DNA helicase RuvB
MSFLAIDDLGLDETDRKILECLIYRYNGKPVGLNALASAIGASVDNVSDVYEPYLVQIGLINRTPKGRVATRKAYEHLHIPVPENLKEE